MFHLELNKFTFKFRQLLTACPTSVSTAEMAKLAMNGEASGSSCAPPLNTSKTAEDKDDLTGVRDIIEDWTGRHTRPHLKCHLWIVAHSLYNVQLQLG